ncbi:MaoC-like dehydratase [Paraglaciecola sp. T6c]|uniref:MaoC family dehydratase n=1 Tax=Pseudoalteromonas atlantica (strain T6c / ATCC BAA-1087) TaxID=3042615 RepID=UPI0000DA6E46|nr:MaoC/PaaZ C-terminal domain-containing protein [Paraglaciecola sp. T6c]ABG41663.1 MaoC-like dehydratase [Paraglaciecola sp. T6c]
MKTPLTTLPRFANLMFRAALKRDNITQLPPTFDDFPKQPLSFAPARLLDSSIEQFHAVTGWRAKHLHPCYLHVVSFPMHLMLMLQKDFPFALLGLVHINNEIIQYRPVQASEACVFRCHFKDMKSHAKGIVFSIVTDVHVDGELCWSSVSSNLYRSTRFSAMNKESTPANEATTGLEGSAQSKQMWQLHPGLGRDYARASGDFNPIHLSKLSARLFGFKHAIAHGMWSKSRCLSALEQIDQDLFIQPFNTQVQFIKPAMLPGRVVFSQYEATHSKAGDIGAIDEVNSKEVSENTQERAMKFSLKNQDTGAPHLSGKVQSL